MEEWRRELCGIAGHTHVVLQDTHTDPLQNETPSLPIPWGEFIFSLSLRIIPVVIRKVGEHATEPVEPFLAQSAATAIHTERQPPVEQGKGFVFSSSFPWASSGV